CKTDESPGEVNDFNNTNNGQTHTYNDQQYQQNDCSLSSLGEDHYLTEQHQHALLKIVRHMLSQLNDRQTDIDLPRTTTTGALNPATAQLEELYKMLNILNSLKSIDNTEIIQRYIQYNV
ncbi:unnamed protein product, partial [Rotaria sordida]